MLRADRHFLVFSMEKPAGRNRNGVCCLSAHVVPWQNTEDYCSELSPYGTSTVNQASSSISCIPLSRLDLSGQGPCPFACPAPHTLAGLREQGWDNSESCGPLSLHQVAHPPALRAPEGHLQTFATQYFCLRNCKWQ